MKVKDLMDKLAEYNEDLEVMVCCGDTVWRDEEDIYYTSYDNINVHAMYGCGGPVVHIDCL